MNDEKEFDRLERQSAPSWHDYQKDLQGLEVNNGAFILDAGCGSGIVSRYLANKFPSSRLVACDYTSSLLAKARNAAIEIKNITFEEQDLKNMSYASGQFDLVISRFVTHLQDVESLSRIISEMVRVLKPGGKLVVIDIDGVVFNLYPQTPAVEEGLHKLTTTKEVDIFIGRKLPYLLSEAGLESVSWRVERMDFVEEVRKHEREGMHERFKNASAFYERVIGGKEKWQVFYREYFECLEHPQCVYFYNKFIVSAIKPE